MAKKYKIAVALLLTFIMIFSSETTKAASTDYTLEIGEVRSIGESAIVPVILHNTDELTSGQLRIELPARSSGVSVDSFETGDLFDGELFRTKENITEKAITIDFISKTGEEQDLGDYEADEKVVIGYITYQLSEPFTPGQSFPLEVTTHSAIGEDGEKLTLNILGGQIEHRIPAGDVIGNNEVTATGAMRVLQHIQGDYITDREKFLSADVNSDGLLTQSDAIQILDYATGKLSTFFSIAAKDLSDGTLQSEYSENIEVRHGRAPYEFDYSGSLPDDLVLNEETGEITGIADEVGEYTFVVEATDALGYEAERSFTITIIDSDIASVETIEPINVKSGEEPDLPSQVTVTYKDGTTGKEDVKWDEVDTSTLGTVSAKGSVGDTGMTVNVAINIVNENYIENVTVDYFRMLNIHALVVDTTEDVYAVSADGIGLHYEGSDQFSLASSSFNEETVTLRLYDQYGNLLETKIHRIEGN